MLSQPLFDLGCVLPACTTRQRSQYESSQFHASERWAQLTQGFDDGGQIRVVRIGVARVVILLEQMQQEVEHLVRRESFGVPHLQQ